MRSFVTFSALLSVASATTLTQFKPDVSGLPSACDAIYKSQINGCTDADFGPGASCSKACYQSLNQLTVSVLRYCSNKGIKGENIITAFLSGSGARQICPKVSSGTSNQQSSSSTSTTQQSTTSTTSSSLSSSSSQSVSSASSSSTTQATSTTLRTTISSITTASGTPTPPSSSASSTTSSIRGYTSSISLSHAGSPFDSTMNLRSSATRLSLDSWVAAIVTMTLPYFVFAFI